MKNWFYLFLLIVLVSFNCSTKNLILQKNIDGKYYFDELKMKISLPNVWKQFGKKEKNGAITGYNFIREPIKDKKGRPILPFIGIMYEKVPTDLNVIMYSVFKRKDLPTHEILKVITGDHEKYKLKYGMAYLIRYNDDKGIFHKIFVIHITNGKGKGIQIIIDGTESVFEIMEKEYIDIINSIEFDL